VGAECGDLSRRLDRFVRDDLGRQLDQFLRDGDLL
jgi:hypothetical protein